MEFVFMALILMVVAFAATSIKIITQARAGIVERLGKFHGIADTGVNVLVPVIDRMRAIIDMREQIVDYPPQPVITRDNVTMQIDTVVYYQVTDPIKYTYEIANPRSAIEYLTATTLRNIVGDMDLDQTLTSRDTVNLRLRQVLDEATDKWGIKVTRVEIRNIAPPRDLLDAMEKQMRAERERRESILRAEGDKSAAILRSEGEKEAQVQLAEGQRQAAILRAQGEAEAILSVEKAKAEGIRMVYGAIKESDPTKEVVAIRSLEALERVSDGKATKIIIPSEAAGVLGALAGFKGVLEGKEASPAKSTEG
jgi:regulator of protease activity HflC (stomatin/prohibitin superfamily)